ncbi:uncharacterized protein LOC62_07G008914 [Vanrija pseudolonga]|uniref:Uncharacterized protein n=1 Tax=Vanrija pseudolonga TaxID=143232 RepID=A0AAF0YEN5_9TREE|nr:hypothetical protein LOC62_07G008914 [Vanrija pseudolonga]
MAPEAAAPSPPSPGVMLDHLSYPHIFDVILAHAPLDFFRNLRVTSRAMYARASPVLYSHICIEVTQDLRVTFRSPYSGDAIPGLSWAAERRERTLSRIARHTRIVDDWGSANNMWDRPKPVVLEEIGALALLAALKNARIVRAPAVDVNGRTYTGWAEAVRAITRNRLGTPAPTDGTFPHDLDERNPLHRVIANTRADENLPGVRVLLPATTTIVFTTISEDNNPLFPVYAFPPNTERAIVNVAFTDTAAAPVHTSEPPAVLPRRLAHLVGLIATPPADHTWTWAGRRSYEVGVLQSIKDTLRAHVHGSRVHSITLVGVERIDPVYYNATGVDAASRWEDRKQALGRLLRFQTYAMTPSAARPHLTWRLLTFAEWRAEVGDEMYALSTVAPWDPWPEVLPHTGGA